MEALFVTIDPGSVVAKQSKAIIPSLLYLTADPTFLMPTSCLDLKH